MRRILFSLLCLLLLALPTFAQNDNMPLTLTIDGIERIYYLHIPDSALSPAPAVLILHGGGGDAPGMRVLTHFDEISDEHGFIAVYPEAINRSWNDRRGDGSRPRSRVDDVAFLRALIAELIAAHGVDPARVYVTGISNGGFMSQRMACDAADIVTAIAPVAANITQDMIDSCEPSRPIATLMIHGANDRVVPFEGGESELLRRIVGVLLSGDEAAGFWAANASCAQTYTVTELPNGERLDRTQTDSRIFDECPDDAPVEHWVSHGAGHTWPSGFQYLPAGIIGYTSRDFDAGQAIWNFFTPLSLPELPDSVS